MPADIAPNVNLVLVPSGTLTFTSSREVADLGHRLWEQLHNLYERFEPHRANLANLARSVGALRTWGADWDDYDAAPPTSVTVDLAEQWIKDLYLDVVIGERAWVDPLIAASEDGEATFEWQLRGRRLTIRVTEVGVAHSKLWGPPPNFDYAEGVADTRQAALNLWVWLSS